MPYYLQSNAAHCCASCYDGTCNDYGNQFICLKFIRIIVIIITNYVLNKFLISLEFLSKKFLFLLFYLHKFFKKIDFLRKKNFFEQFGIYSLLFF